MCGRYALSFRPSHVRSRLAHQNMPVDEAPEDDDDMIRSTYNFAPGYHGLIYRAHTSDRGAGQSDNQDGDGDANSKDGEPPAKRAKTSLPSSQHSVDGHATNETKYKLQAAKWGMIPFWTVRPPDYGSQLRTINCRDDSLLENRGLWNISKQRKRCIVMCEGFYEWLKKNNGKEKVPHFVKRTDGQLMCFAALWDMVMYEGSQEKLYSYAIITTDSNKQLKFLHDRMPVILEAGSDAMKAWLDPNNIGWSKELQSLLKPYDGNLDCYPVDKSVGKVGNNSASFIIPVDSKENKKNIANFFGAQRAKAEDAAIKKEQDDERDMSAKVEGTEDNAPIPKPKGETDESLSQHMKQETGTSVNANHREATDEQNEKAIKREIAEIDDAELIQAAESTAKKAIKTEQSGLSPSKNVPAKKTTGGRKTRSSTANSTVAKTPTKEGNARITSFFGK